VNRTLKIFSVVPTFTWAVTSTTLFIENFKKKKKSKKLKSLLKKIGTGSQPALLKIVNFVLFSHWRNCTETENKDVGTTTELRNLQN